MGRSQRRSSRCVGRPQASLPTSSHLASIATVPFTCRRASVERQRPKEETSPISKLWPRTKPTTCSLGGRDGRGQPDHIQVQGGRGGPCQAAWSARRCLGHFCKVRHQGRQCWFKR